MNTKFSLNISQLPKELRLILELLKMEEVTQISPKEWLEDINWDLFVELAFHHRLYPLLNDKINKLNKDLIPRDVVQAIRNEYITNTFKMLYLSGEMEQVSQLFTKNNIPLLFLKGPVLGEDLFGDVSLRTSGDLDFLIPINELERAENLLLKQGYEKDDYIQTVLNDWKWRHHHITFFHPEKEIKLEVHWRLNPGPGVEPSFDDLWGRKRISLLTSSPVYYLGKEDLFLFLVTHGARHGWSRLRWLIDINQLVKQDMDWSEIRKLLEKYHCADSSGQALILAMELLDLPVTQDMKILIKGKRPLRLASEALFYLENMVNLHTEPVPENVAEYHKRHLFHLMSKKQRLFFILSFLYPYPEDAKTLPLPNQLHFLYFILRPFLWVWRKTKNQAFS